MQPAEQYVFRSIRSDELKKVCDPTAIADRTAGAMISVLATLRIEGLGFRSVTNLLNASTGRAYGNLFPENRVCST
jgi:hypothetical protein